MPGRKQFKIPDEITVLVPAPPITKMAFRGGGAKGAAYPGAIQALEKLKVVESLETVSGASAGSMIALFVALGFNSQEIEKLTAKMNFNDFLDPSSKNNVADRGICDGKILHRTFKTLINQKMKKHILHLQQLIETETINKDHKQFVLNRLADMLDKPYTFKSLEYLNNLYKAHTGKNVLKDLLIAGTNITDSKLAVFSAKTTPEMELALAVRISTSYPIVFKAVTYEGKQYIDGGAFDNLPVRMLNQFNSDKGFRFLSEASQRQATLSLMLGEGITNKILHKFRHWYPSGIFTAIKMYLFHSIFKINIPQNYASTRQVLHDDYGMRTLGLPTRNLTTLTFKMSDEERINLKHESFGAVIAYFKTREREALHYQEKDLVSCLLQMDSSQFNAKLYDHLAQPILDANPETNLETQNKIHLYVKKLADNVFSQLTQKKFQAHKLVSKTKNLVCLIAEYKELIKDENLWFKPSFKKIKKRKNAKIKRAIKEVKKLYDQYLIFHDVQTGMQSTNPRHRQILNERLQSHQDIFSSLIDSLSYYNYTKNPINEPYVEGDIPMGVQLIDTLQFFELQRKKQEMMNVLLFSREKYFQRKQNIKLIGQILTGVRAANTFTELEYEVRKLRKHYKPRTFFSSKSPAQFETARELTRVLESERLAKKVSPRRTPRR